MKLIVPLEKSFTKDGRTPLRKVTKDNRNITYWVKQPPNSQSEEEIFARVLNSILTTGNDQKIKSDKLGQVTVELGKEGTKAKNWKDGHGLLHIIARRISEGIGGNDVARTLVGISLAIAHGELRRAYGGDGGRVDLSYKGYTAVISKQKHGKVENWLLTGFKDKGSDAVGESYNPDRYLPGVSGSRRQVGAELLKLSPTNPKIVKSSPLLFIRLEKAKKDNPKLVYRTDLPYVRNGVTRYRAGYILPEDAKKLDSAKGNGSPVPSIHVVPDLFDTAFDEFLEEEKKQLFLVGSTAEGAGLHGKIEAVNHAIDDGNLVFHYKIGGKWVSESETKLVAEKNDRRITEVFQTVTPETRPAAELALFGGDPTPQEPKYSIKDFEPNEVELKLGDNVVSQLISQGHIPMKGKVLSYADVMEDEVGLVSEKNILGAERPTWIPAMADDYFNKSGFRVQFTPLAEGDGYLLLTADKGAVIAPLFIVAATQDYYMKRAKALEKARMEDYKKKHPGYKWRSKRVASMSENRATYTNMGLHRVVNVGVEAWKTQRTSIADLKQKMADMECQYEDDQSSFAKGRETAYGDKGTVNDLVDEVGVKVKRQNGDPVDETWLDGVKASMTELYGVFGDRSSMAKKWGLKISCAADKAMHARKAIGIFFPHFHAIGVSGAAKSKDFGFTLAHEFGHFMDFYVGKQNGKHYSSDDYVGPTGKVVSAFRGNMKTGSPSKYWERTCEVFARSMEQYFAEKTGDGSGYGGREWYCKSEDFQKNVAPVIEEWLKSHNELLKAMPRSIFEL